MSARLLLIFAHPDDESFALGGTIAKAADAGVEIRLVTATKGEAGKTAGLCPQEELGAYREQELLRAARVLGIGRVDFLGYRDKELSQAPPLRILGQLLHVLREFRPLLVITFGEDGGSGHRDHRAIHHFTKAAIRLAAQPGLHEWGERFSVPRLCYVQSGWRLSAEVRAAMDFVVPIEGWAERKWAAVREHRTQAFSIRKFETMAEEHKRHYFTEEYFLCDRELSAVPGRGDDLFAGL